MTDHSRQSKAAGSDIVRLLSLDFDGTIVDWEEDGYVCDEFFHRLLRFREDGGLWALNTGRDIHQASLCLDIIPGEIQPDFLLLAEREIHEAHAHGWKEVHEWNDRCREDHDNLREQAANTLNAFRDVLESHQVLRIEGESDGGMTGFVAQDNEQMEKVLIVFEEFRKETPTLSYQRNSIYLRFCHVDYHKGAILKELSRRLELSPAQVFAMGDNHNDLSMFAPDVAGKIACPDNAIDEVKETIRRHGGLVARARCSEGICEAFSHFQIAGS